jgi:sugar phosphate isomerase/epimerase
VAGATALGARHFGFQKARLGAIGIQLYTVRNQFQADPEGTLRRLAQIGYKEVEFAGYPPGSAQDVREMLQRHGLTAPSSHVNLRAVDDTWQQTLDFAAAVGQRYVTVPSFGGADRRTLDGIKRVAARFNQAAEAARKHGLTFSYHNHDFEFAPVEGAVPFDVLLAETDPKLVTFEMDLYWITKGGKDPLDYFAKWPGRFPQVHVKDMDGSPRKFFADLGTGTIDFARIFRKARQAGIRHYYYEQDETPGDPLLSAQASYRYLRGLQF